MKVTIIGCGYVGKALAKALMALGCTVFVTTTTSQRVEELKPVASEVHVLSVDESEELSPLIAQSDAVILTIAPREGASHSETYVTAAKSLQEIIAKLQWRGVLIYTGSTAVYGDATGQWVDEDTPVQKERPRAHALATTEERLLELEKSGVRVIVLRLGEIYGPEREFSTKLQRWGSQPFPGDGTNLTNMVHRDDIVLAILHILQGGWHGVFNLCNDTHMERKAFYNEICKTFDLAPVQWDPSKATIFGGNRKVSSERIKATGFVFTHPKAW